ncbi:DNA-3-methyladenine glycosylase I [Spirochaeta isovalerica]|uniref:DNA-3-methyladenine glycosylase I n=1 Tax=Spirochaeta isovalerica TaxID=150 RepID=A0A841RD42_9SPIO|nr:DNA-3-methyladenine glycosylase I [Spirochaeta isovalerica]MBB6480568.1 DNA-3-methyladenine glycosylase I [Spirochaeta isovalerica]
MEKCRCIWCGNDPLYREYHDREWGVPVYDNEKKHFENLVLESAQAGLSWITILRRRENYRKAYEGFDPENIARWGEVDVQRLMADAGVIRNRRKIESSINNARRFLEVKDEFGSFSHYYWHFQDGIPIVNHWVRQEEVPAKTELAEIIAKDMKKRGFSFLGPVVTYANMQSVGMVNDHLVSCFRFDEIEKMKR